MYNDMTKLSKRVEELEDTVLRMRRDYDDALGNISRENMDGELRNLFKSVEALSPLLSALSVDNGRLKINADGIDVYIGDEQRLETHYHNLYTTNIVWNFINSRIYNRGSEVATE